MLSTPIRGQGVDKLEKKRWDSGTVDEKPIKFNGLGCPTPFGTLGTEKSAGTVGQLRSRYDFAKHTKGFAYRNSQWHGIFVFYKL